MIASDLRDLYQEVILDHGKRPRNFGTLADATHDAEGENPLCGDHLHLYVKADGTTIEAAQFEGNGCAISKASASMMTGAIKGKTRDEVEAMIREFTKMATGTQEADFDPDTLGKLAVFAGVQEFPSRVKCATLAWHTMKAALDGKGVPVSTE